jgi:glutamate dehydrogenase
MANSVYQSASMAGVHEDWMERLAHSGLLDRELEALPSTEEMDNRRSKNRGLTSPELATLMAYTKIVLEDEILGSDLPDDPYLSDRLISYFPTAMRERYAAVMPAHRLRREIITTMVVNQFVDASGITCFHRLSAETGASAADVIRAQIAARTIFDVDQHERAIRDLDHRVDSQVQMTLRMEVRTLVERATRWLINNYQRPLDISTAVHQMSSGVRQVQEALPTVLQGRDHDEYEKRLQSYRTAGVPDDLAAVTAALSPAYAALTVVQTADREALGPVSVAEVHFTVGQRLGLDRLLSRMIELPRDDRWQTMARAALRDDLHAAHAQLTAEVLAGGEAGNGARELVAAWERKTPSVHEVVKTLRSICAGRPDLARMSVGLRIVRGLLSKPNR